MFRFKELKATLTLIAVLEQWEGRYSICSPTTLGCFLFGTWRVVRSKKVILLGNEVRKAVALPFIHFKSHLCEVINVKNTMFPYRNATSGAVQQLGQ